MLAPDAQRVLAFGQTISHRRRDWLRIENGVLDPGKSKLESINFVLRIF
jgi:hypothetical protein